MRIAVAGTGYVGLSKAMMLAQHNQVLAVDILSAKVTALNQGHSPIVEPDIDLFLANPDLNFYATRDTKEAYRWADLVIIATPTDYDPIENFFNTRSVEEVIELVVSVNPEATIVIKSTVPVGFTELMKRRFGIENIFFSPEFLREGKALHDNLYLSRIICWGAYGCSKSLCESACRWGEKERCTAAFC